MVSLLFCSLVFIRFSFVCVRVKQGRDLFLNSSASRMLRRRLGIFHVQALLDYDLPLEHTHSTCEIEHAALGRSEVNHDRFIQRQIAFDVERGNHNRCAARRFDSAHESYPRESFLF